MSREPKSRWDIIRIRPPLCHLPPPWEWIINHDVELLKELAVIEPSSELAALERYFKTRINIVNRLVDAKKLDSKIGSVAINHFNAHLEELASLRMR